MFDFFGHRKRNERLKKDVLDSFDHVRKDFEKVGEWISHIDDKNNNHTGEMRQIKDQVLSLQKDILEIKDFISFFEPAMGGVLSKQTQTDVPKQSETLVVQTPVQTPVQTEILEHLTVMERAIVWALLNAEMKLSYEDLAALLGKKKSTIRGQINSIKQKSERLIKESREPTGKKRLFIPDEIKKLILKNVKVRIKGTEK